MNLSRLLGQRAEAEDPVRVALIGAGKFGSMFLTQARLTRGLHVAAIVDLDPSRVQRTLATCSWPAEQSEARSLSDAIASGRTYVGEDLEQVLADQRIEVVIEATGDPAVGIRHCLAVIEHGKHVVMVNVEADVLAGPLLAQRALRAGVVYSLAWGDQPALICEHVDWARACGFDVVCAGKGTRYLPAYHTLTPDTVWDVLTQYLDITDRSLINPKMFNSFLDGTKSGIEMTAVCNATGLQSQPNGLAFPPASRFELSHVCKPSKEGGTLAFSGTTEVVSSLTRAGDAVPHHLAMGTFVVIAGATDYARQCFREYHMLEDESGHYAALYRPTHMIGMELGVSVASAALRGEATGAPRAFAADVVATAKRDLKAGEMLDGEGGATVWGKQQPARASLGARRLPLGLAADVRLLRDVAAGDMLSWDDVDIDPDDAAVRIRKEMETVFRPV